MSIRLLQADGVVAWDQYVKESSSATCYHLSRWKDVIERSFGHRTYYLYSEEADGRIDGILPLVQIKSSLFGNYIVSLPFFNYGGVCAGTAETGQQLITHAADLALKAGATHIEFRHTTPLRPDLPVKLSKVSMRLALTQDPDDLLRSFPSKLRSQIQRPVREGMYASIGGEELLPDYYAVLSENMRDLGTPVYSREFFRNILRMFPDTTRICMVYAMDRTPVAAGFLVGYKRLMEIPWASSLRRYNRWSPNMLLYWSVLKFSCENGYGQFDFGRSTPNEGTYRFKEQWGAVPVQLYWHYWIKNGGPLPELNPKNIKFRMAIEIWKRIPVPITRLIGPAIVKNLP